MFLCIFSPSSCQSYRWGASRDQESWNERGSPNKRYRSPERLSADAQRSAAENANSFVRPPLLKSLTVLSCPALCFYSSLTLSFIFATDITLSTVAFCLLIFRFAALLHQQMHSISLVLLTQLVSFKFPKLRKSLKRSQDQLWRNHHHQKVPTCLWCWHVPV